MNSSPTRATTTCLAATRPDAGPIEGSREGSLGTVTPHPELPAQVVEFLQAGGAGGEGGQAGVGAGEGLGRGDAVAGTAGAAADQGVAEAAVGRIGQLRQAGRAGGQVGAEGWRHQADAQGVGGAGADADAAGFAWGIAQGPAPDRQPVRLQRLQAPRQGQLPRQPLEQTLQGRAGALKLQHHRAHFVLGPAAEAQLQRQPVHKGPEPDPLNNAVAAQLQAAGAQGVRAPIRA